MEEKEDQVAEYAFIFVQALNSALKNKKNNGNIELNDDNAVDVFTAMIMACGFVYNQLTGEEKSYLEFTYLANQLIVENLLEDK